MVNEFAAILLKTIIKLSCRPIAGYANLCPNMISTQPQEFVGMLSTVKHEIIHALVRFDIIKCVSLKLVLLPSWKRRMSGEGEALTLPVSTHALIALRCSSLSVPAANVNTSMALDLLCECLTKGSYLLYLQGFSAGLFAFYRDDDGKPLTARYADGLPPFNERY